MDAEKISAGLALVSRFLFRSPWTTQLSEKTLMGQLVGWIPVDSPPPMSEITGITESFLKDFSLGLGSHHEADTRGRFRNLTAALTALFPFSARQLAKVCLAFKTPLERNTAISGYTVGLFEGLLAKRWSEAQEIYDIGVMFGEVLVALSKGAVEIPPSSLPTGLSGALSNLVAEFSAGEDVAPFIKGLLSTETAACSEKETLQEQIFREVKIKGFTRLAPSVQTTLLKSAYR